MARYFLQRGSFDAHTAEELTSDTFEALLVSMFKGGNPRTTWRQYMYGIAYNKLVGQVRKQIADRGYLADGDEFLAAREDAESAWAHVADGDLPTLFQRCINILTKYETHVLYLRHHVDLEYEHIAQVLGRSEQAVRQGHASAMRKIRNKPVLMAWIRLRYRRRTHPYDPKSSTWTVPEE
ncbi:RNA polymerase sigma factor [Streptomyces sp. H39-C1]|uniref:RNA polymerase sigma factor n=1 Tax=Streptomyces sp. H39-C1 TaxID=3004355 RepID=UPI0022AEC173|nr:RNA polymerase sigma factor [Streptomyces sp. H39-C1]MCZ4101944.1 RNA polymerase sigma factor [Streptomyces sp. H39-C1]